MLLKLIIGSNLLFVVKDVECFHFLLQSSNCCKITVDSRKHLDTWFVFISFFLKLLNISFSILMLYVTMNFSILSSFNIRLTLFFFK